MLRHFDHVLFAADSAPDRAGHDHGKDAAEDAHQNDPAEIHTQHGSHQHGAGRGRNKGVADSQTGQQRDNVVQHRALGALCQREGQRDQDDQAGVKEHGHGDDKTGDAQRPCGFFVAELAHHGHCDALRTAGFFQNGTEHGAEAHQKGDALEGVADALVHRADDIGQRHTGHQSDGHGTHQNGDHGVHFELDDEDEQKDQARHRGEHEPRSVRGCNSCHKIFSSVLMFCLPFGFYRSSCPRRQPPGF